jgi:hypothetical protein
MPKKGRYRCIHCGDRFDLSAADQEDMDEGFYETQPDCCDDCLDMFNHPCHDISELYSDADPGL